MLGNARGNPPIVHAYNCPHLKHAVVQAPPTLKLGADSVCRTCKRQRRPMEGMDLRSRGKRPEAHRMQHTLPLLLVGYGSYHANGMRTAGSSCTEQTHLKSAHVHAAQQIVLAARQHQRPAAHEAMGCREVVDG